MRRQPWWSADTLGGRRVLSPVDAVKMASGQYRVAIPAHLGPKSTIERFSLEWIGAAGVVDFLAMQRRIEDASQREIAAGAQLVTVVFVERIERSGPDRMDTRCRVPLGGDFDLAVARNAIDRLH